MSRHILEPAAQEFAEAAAKPPLLYERGVEGARRLLDDVQAAPVEMPDADEKWITVPAAAGDVRVRLVRPPDTPGALPVVLYVHGGGWILGNAGTHDRLVRELSVGARAPIAFVEYDRSPEARYPVAIEQAHAAAQWITGNGAAEGLEASRMAVAGDSVGGTMAAALDDLAGLPPALVIVDENDVLRDEGEAYARRLTEAGVPTTSVRYNGALHDFMMLDPVRDTHATRAATTQAITALTTALHTRPAA